MQVFYSSCNLAWIKASNKSKLPLLVATSSAVVPSRSAADTSALALSSVVAMATLAARLASMSGVAPAASAAFTSACRLMTNHKLGCLDGTSQMGVYGLGRVGRP